MKKLKQLRVHLHFLFYFSVTPGKKRRKESLEDRVSRLEKKQERHEREQIDLKRQSYKKNLLLQGPHLPLQMPGEEPLSFFVNLVKIHFGVTLHR